jgi:hypothetical protein
MDSRKFESYEEAAKFVRDNCESVGVLRAAGQPQVELYAGRQWMQLVASKLDDDFTLLDFMPETTHQLFGFRIYAETTFASKLSEDERKLVREMFRQRWSVGMSVFAVDSRKVWRLQDNEFVPIIKGKQKMYGPMLEAVGNELRKTVPDSDEWSIESLCYKYAMDTFETTPEPQQPDPQPAQQPQQQPQQAPQAQGQYQSPEDVAFVGMLRQTFAKAVSENLVDEVLPQIKQRVIDEFGFEPVRHEVKVVDEVKNIDGVVHEKFELILNLVANDQPVYMYGPCGSGKGYLVKQVAKSLGLDFYAMNSVTDEFKISGFIDANGKYQESEFYRAFTNGGIFFLDEMDASAPEVLVCLNMAIADRYFTFPNGRVDANPNFRVVAAGNTLGTGATAQYTGRMQLDAATLNRFAVVFVGYDEKIELNEADNDKQLVDFIHKFRKTVKKDGINAAASYRNISMLRIMSQFSTKEEALSACLLKGMNQDDINMVSNSIGTNGEWAQALANCKAMA